MQRDVLKESGSSRSGVIVEMLLLLKECRRFGVDGEGARCAGCRGALMGEGEIVSFVGCGRRRGVE